MLALFLPVIVSKKNIKKREKYVFYCSVLQIHINPPKMAFCDVPITRLRMLSPSIERLYSK